MHGAGPRNWIGGPRPKALRKPHGARRRRGSNSTGTSKPSRARRRSMPAARNWLAAEDALILSGEHSLTQLGIRFGVARETGRDRARQGAEAWTARSLGAGGNASGPRVGS